MLWQRAQTASILRSCSLVVTLAACQTMNKVQHFKHWALCAMMDAEWTELRMCAREWDSVYRVRCIEPFFDSQVIWNAFGARQWRGGMLSMARFLLRTICVRQLNLFARFHYVTFGCGVFRRGSASDDAHRVRETWTKMCTLREVERCYSIILHLLIASHPTFARNSLETLTRRYILPHFGTFNRCPCRRRHIHPSLACTL